MSVAEIVMAGLAALSMLIAFLGFRGGRAREVQQDVAGDEALRADVRYLVRGVDDIRADQRAQGKQIGEIEHRLTKCEESTKSAHRRMDEHVSNERG